MKNSFLKKVQEEKEKFSQENHFIPTVITISPYIYNLIKQELVEYFKSSEFYKNEDFLGMLIKINYEFKQNQFCFN